MHNEQESWTSDDIAQMITNPILVGLGTTPAIIDTEMFARTGARVIKEIGVSGYLECIYNNLIFDREFTERTLALGTRPDFITLQKAKLRKAPTTTQGVKQLIELLRDHFSVRSPKQTVQVKTGGGKTGGPDH